jgi:hypothetical protein
MRVVRRCLDVLMVVAGLVFGAGNVAAQEPDLVTDRPDFTESSETVGRGYVQVESGFAYEREGRGAERTGTLTAPVSLARIGIARRVELRVGTDGVFSSATGPDRVTGVADVETGVKVRFLDQAQAGVDMAVIPMVSFPTGSDVVSSGQIDPTVKLTWARELPFGFGLSGNYNVSSLTEAGRRFAQQALSVSLGHDLLAGFGGYIEAFGFSPMSRGTSSGWTIDGGVSRLFGPNVQLDLEAGRGITSEAPDWFIGFGVAVRTRMF